MKENKDQNIKVRLTFQERKILEDYCGQYETSISQAVRQSIQQFILEKMKDKQDNS